MGITPLQFEQMQRRLAVFKRENGNATTCVQPWDNVSQEIEQLHKPIIEWCEKQFPRIPYIHSRSDRATTIAAGCPDFIIFFNSHCLCIECKTKTGKMTTEQIAWKLMLETQGFEYHLVRTLTEFKKVVRDAESCIGLR